MTSQRKGIIIGPKIASFTTPKSSSTAKSSNQAKKQEPQKGPSIFAILATKRLVRRFADRVAARRLERGATIHREHEPTYRMEPKIKFSPSKVEEAIAEVVQQRLRGLAYTPKKCLLLSKVLSEEIKDSIKELGFERYKLVCVVTMGQVKDQGLRISSRCSWDDKVDNSATYNWREKDLFCSVTVFGLYRE